MDVRCDRCETEYDFDDALISLRGTSVQCTNCGHRFRIFPVTAEPTPELWSIRTESGQEHVFTSLKELQRAIVARRVGRADLLSRGAEPPRSLGAIAELQTFFPEEAPADAPLARTLHGVAPATQRALEPALEPRERQRHMTLPLGSESVLGAIGEPARPEPQPPEAALPEPTPAPPEEIVPQGQAAPAVRTPTLRRPPSSQQPQPIVARAAATPQSSVRDSIPDDDDLPVESRYWPHHRAQARWIAGLVIVAVLALFGGTVGRKYIARFASVARRGPETSDQRLSDLLDQGRRQLDVGELDAAEQALSRATGLGQRDAAVRAEVLRLETVRADLVWLELRLIDPAARERRATLERALAAQIDRATRAVAAAQEVAAAPEGIARHRVDVARMRGDLVQARRLVGPVAARAHLPENAYTLAVLDLADPAPAWISVLDRLRLSAARAREAGRARVALVYGLVKAGHQEQAELELEKFGSRKPLPALFPELTEFVRRESGERPDAGVADAAATPVAASGSTRRGSAAAEAPAVGDFRAQLQNASRALARGELGRAETLFRAALAAQPDNTEALTGLADVAGRRGETAAAAALYDRVLARNPSYVPAMLARADQKWAAGDRAGAIALYRRVVEEGGPESSYGRHAMQRIKQSEAPPAAASADAAPAGDADAGAIE